MMIQRNMKIFSAEGDEGRSRFSDSESFNEAMILMKMRAAGTTSQRLPKLMRYRLNGADTTQRIQMSNQSVFFEF